MALERMMDREESEKINHHYIPVYCLNCRALIKWENPVLYLSEGKKVPLLCKLCDYVIKNRKKGG